MSKFGMLPSLLQSDKPRQRWRRWIIGAVVLLILAVLARPAYQATKRWRARDMAQKAEIHISQEQWEDAFRIAQAAYQLAPTEPSAIRAVARLYSRLQQDQAFSFWEALLALPESTPDDRRQYVELALDLKRTELAEPVLQQLLKDQPDDIGNLRLASKYHIAKGDEATALRYVKRAAELRPEDTAVQLALSQLLLRSPRQEERQQAAERLWTLSEGRNQAALEALTLLATQAPITKNDAEELINRLNRHPLAKAEHQLMALEIQIRLAPTRKPALIEDFVSVYKTVPREKQIALGRWLNRQSMFEPTVQLITSSAASMNKDMFLVRLDALAGLKRWKEVGTELAADPLPVEGWMRELYRARVAHELGDETKAEAHWRRVHLEAAKEPQALTYIAHYAERTGAPKEAAKAYRRLTQQTGMARPAFLALIRLAETEGNTRSLREIMREMTALFPQDPAPRNDLAYLNLLLDENVESARDIASRLLEENPNMLAYRITLSLAHLRLKQPAEARKLFESRTINWPAVLPGWQAVYGAVLASSGQTNAARAFSRMIPQQRLKPEERALLKPLF